MSAILERLHALLDDVKSEVEKLFGHADAEVADAAKAAAEKVDEIKAAVQAGLPVIGHDAEQDAKQIVHDGETASGPVVAEAEHDAETIATEAEGDAAQAVEHVGDMGAGETAGAAPATAEPPATETPSAS